MKKSSKTKLQLNRTTIRVLQQGLPEVKGGWIPTNACSDSCSFTGDCDPPKP